MSRAFHTLLTAAAAALVIVLITAVRQSPNPPKPAPAPPASTSAVDAAITQNAQQMIAEGQRVFRYDTFGDEAFWGDSSGCTTRSQVQTLGGVGPGVSPKTALALGLKVDAERAAGRRSSQRSKPARSTSTIRPRRSRCSSSTRSSA